MRDVAMILPRPRFAIAVSADGPLSFLDEKGTVLYATTGAAKRVPLSNDVAALEASDAVAVTFTFDAERPEAA